jgi:hypothetical protein
MNPEQTKLVNDLFSLFSNDWALGALEARLRWHRLDDEVAAAVSAWAAHEAGFVAAQQQADLAMGMLGIFGTFGRTGGGDPRAATIGAFAQLIHTLRQWRGDPPVAPALKARAREAATGRLNLVEALQLMGSGQPQLAAFLGAYGAFLGGNPMLATLLGQVVRYVGALAVPREQLHEFYVSLHQDPLAGHRAAFQLAFGEAQARAAQDAASAHVLAAEAFHLAERTPETDDDVQAIQFLLQLPLEILTEQDAVGVANRLVQLVRARQFPASLVNALGTLQTIAHRKQLVAQVYPLLAEAATGLQQANLDAKAWAIVAVSAVELSLRTGRLAAATDACATFRARVSAPGDLALAEILDAEVKWFRGEKESALAMLGRLADALPESERWNVALHLVAMWPPGRPGRAPYVDMAVAPFVHLPAEVAAFVLPMMLSTVERDWGQEPVAALLERIDVEDLRAKVPPERQPAFDQALRPFAPLRPRQSPTVAPAPVPAAPTDPSAAIMQALRERLLRDIARGVVVGARGVELTAFLQEMETLLNLPETTLQELQVKAAKWRALMGRATGFLATPSHVTLPPAGSLRAGARTQLRSLIAMVAQDLLLPLQRPGEREVEHELMRRGFELDGGLVGAAGDDEAKGFLPSVRRLAIDVANHGRRGHVTLARPTFSGPPTTLDVSAVYFAGGEQARAILDEACARRGLALSLAGRAGPAAAETWNRLRSAALGVFDLSVPPGPARAAVCYEMGIALALGKPVVPLVAAGQAPPFNVDVKATELGADVGALLDAVEVALFTPARGEPGDLAATLKALERDLGERGRSGTLGIALDQARAAVDDPVRFRTAVEDLLGLWGAAAPCLLLPAWPATYPDEKRCFHVMPFSEPWSPTVELLVKQACEGAGRARYVRGDQGKDPDVLRRIWSELGRATHVIVDLTNFNANVALELGMAHALGRPTRVVGQGDTPERLFPTVAKVHVYRYQLAPEATLARLVLDHLA